MTILVVGLGSMGKRRIRILKEFYPDYTIIGVDTMAERRIEIEKEFNISTFSSIAAAVKNNNIYAAVVSTAPLSHGHIIEECLRNNMHVFTELNLVSDMYQENIALAKQKNLTLFLSSTFLYRDEISYINNCVSSSKHRLNYTYHVGQYLPDWHPWESFKDFFVGEKRTNGCREIFAIELPWIIKTFGKIENISTIKDNISTLNVDYPDSFLVTLSHENGHKGQFMVDIVTRVPVRHLEIFGEDIQIEWRGKPEELYSAAANFSFVKKVDFKSSVNRVSGYRDFIVEDAYAKELDVFFNVCKGSNEPFYDFNDDLYTLSMIDKIEGV